MILLVYGLPLVPEAVKSAGVIKLCMAHVAMTSPLHSNSVCIEPRPAAWYLHFPSVWIH